MLVNIKWYVNQRQCVGIETLQEFDKVHSRFYKNVMNILNCTDGTW